MAHLRNSTRANALRAKIIGIGSAVADLGGRALRAVSVDEMAKPVLSPHQPGTTGAAIQAIRKRVDLVPLPIYPGNLYFFDDPWKCIPG